MRKSMNSWITGAAIVAGVAVGAFLLTFGLESLLPNFGVPSIVWLLIGLLPLYCIWRKIGGQSRLDLRQLALIVVAVIALDAAIDAVVWGAKAALFAAAIALVLAARRRAATART